jgi:hypothetical protein
MKEQPMTYDDTYIEHWGEVFTAHPCIRRFCTFEQFLRRPRSIIDALAGDTLLPRQLEWQRRIDVQQLERRHA